MRAMRHVIEAEQTYSKDPADWTDKDVAFDREQMRGCQALDEWLEAHHRI